MELDGRKLRILKQIIDDYILTASPVGSRTISKHEDIGLSSATIRNVMSDLVELGYLDQPHTSAGRVPSDKAYRLYVDKLMRTSSLTQDETDVMRRHYNRMFDEVEGVIRETGQMLSNITNYTSVVLAPKLSRVILRRIQLVPVTEDCALAVVVTNAGILRDAIIRIPRDMEIDQLNRLSILITERCKGRTMEDIGKNFGNEMGHVLGGQKNFLNAVLDSVRRSLDVRDVSSVQLSGATNLLNYPEYSDIGKAKNFLAMLETKEVLYELLTRASQVEFSITIGKENEAREMQDCSIVTATYRIGDSPIGSLGVIGPTRMDYAKVLAILSYMGKSLSAVLTGILERDQHDP